MEYSKPYVSSQTGDTVAFRDIDLIRDSENILEFSYIADMSYGKAEFRHVPKEYNSWLVDYHSGF